MAEQYRTLTVQKLHKLDFGASVDYSIGVNMPEGFNAAKILDVQVRLTNNLHLQNEYVQFLTTLYWGTQSGTLVTPDDPHFITAVCNPVAALYWDAVAAETHAYLDPVGGQSYIIGRAPTIARPDQLRVSYSDYGGESIHVYLTVVLRLIKLDDLALAQLMFQSTVE